MTYLYINYKKIYVKNIIKYQQKNEKEYLVNKLNFLDEIIKIIFQNDNVKLVEVYLSDQYSILLEDYYEVVDVINHKFIDALLESYNSTKKHNYYGIKIKRIYFRIII